MSMSAHALHLTRPAPAGVRAWPSVTSRALTGEERTWLEAVPENPLVEFRGVVTVWVRSFFCGLVEHGLRNGSARLAMLDGQPVALLAGGAHIVRGQGAGEVASEARPPADQGRRPFFFSRRKGTTWIEYCQPKEVQA